MQLIAALFFGQMQYGNTEIAQGLKIMNYAVLLSKNELQFALLCQASTTARFNLF